MPKRFGITVLTILTGVLLSASLIAYLAFSAGPDAPNTLESYRMAEPGTVTWSDMGGVVVQANSFDDALVLLGYGHARSRAWQTVLWRQAALGRLSEWFGPDALPLDRSMRQLGIAEGARQSVDSLNVVDREALQNFAHGVDLALGARDLNRSTPFLILGVEAEPWEAWHSVAVERLFAWMSSAPEKDVSDDLPDAWQETELALRRLLRVYGSPVNWVAGIQDGPNPYLAARYASGATGTPLFVETDLDYGNGGFTGLMVPGTLVSLIGRTHADSWALTGRGHRATRQTVLTIRQVSTDHHRISREGVEEVIPSYRDKGSLVLGAIPRSGEAVRVTTLDWIGLGYGADTRIWLQALSGSAPRPRLLDEDGIRWNGTGWALTGTPSNTTRPASHTVLATDAGPKDSPAATVAGQTDPLTLNEWMNMTLSRGADDVLNDLLAYFPDSLITRSREQEALRYLRNWNLEYDAGEPGASIFETLLFELPDSTRSPAIMQQALTRTVRTLSGRYGPDMSSWRWETVQERSVRFPGATDGPADGGRPEERFAQKYQPVTVRAPGHPQTLVWGAPPSTDSLRITSVCEGALDLRTGSLHYRRPTVEFNRFLGTFLTGDRAPDIRILQRTSTDASTTLVPVN